MSEKEVETKEDQDQDQKTLDAIANVEKELEDTRRAAMHFLDEEAKAVIANAKQAGVEVYTIQIGTQFYIFRGLGRFEYQTMLIEQSSQADKIMSEAPSQTAGRIMLEVRNQNEIVQKATLYPRIDAMSVKTLGAGVVETIHNSIMLSSGFGQEPMPIKL